jgi:flagella basal body P-ring formation protein FlgA
MLLTALALAAFEDLDALDRDIAVAASAMSAQAMPVDRRLRLRACPQGVQISTGDARSLDVRCPALGWRLRVALAVAAGTTTPRAPVVRRGDPLIVRTEGAGFVIETAAVATEDGAAGAIVRARLDGGRAISGVVTGPNEVSVGRLNIARDAPLSSTMRGSNEEAER